MSLATLRAGVMHRPGSSSQTDRYSVDFIVDGRSLLAWLSGAAGRADLMGCFVSGFPKVNKAALRRLTLKEPPDTPRGGRLIYICPECGDIGCGAYSVIVEKGEGCYTWRDFAYENGHEEPHTVDGVGPFDFEAEAYISEISVAAL